MKNLITVYLKSQPIVVNCIYGYLKSQPIKMLDWHLLVKLFDKRIVLYCGLASFLAHMRPHMTPPEEIHRGGYR